MQPRPPVYERIGTGYAGPRRPEPAWERAITAALDGAATVINVGAGTGSYEPGDRTVVAVEPSAVMVAQRAAGSAPVVRGVAEALPFADGAFDAALAVLTLHHWSDPAAGLRELARVARRQVVVTWDPGVFAEEFWLVRDYLPEAVAREAALPTLTAAVAGLGPPVRVIDLPVPAGCRDGFFAAYWRRPEAYLDPQVRAAVSGLALLPEQVVLPAVARLADDLATGTWHERYADLLDRDALDVGYRLVVSGGTALTRPAGGA